MTTKKSKGRRVAAKKDAASPGLTINVHAHAAESEPAFKRAVDALRTEPAWTWI